MDAIKRIDQLMDERSWTDYRLAMESGLSISTIANIHRRNTVPSVHTLESICKAFGITLSQFFNDDTESVQLNAEQKNLFDKWISLTESQKRVISDLINEFK